MYRIINLLPQNVKVEYRNKSREKLVDLLERDFSDNEIAALCGALDSSLVIIESRNDFFLVSVYHAKMKEQSYFIGQDGENELFVRIDRFFPLVRGEKLGLQSLVRQAFMGQITKINYLSTEADGNFLTKERVNGYFVWALYGFDAILNENEMAKLPDRLKHIEYLNDLMLIGAKDWWLKNGSERTMFFDLKPESNSFQVLKNYLHQKKWRVKF